MVHMANRITRKKIAVTGIGNSGKTVFLTSLLWQLHESENADFHLEKDVKITGFREIRRDSTFPFGKFQDTMAKRGEWPSKTTDIHRYVGQFNRSDRRWKQKLEFLDFPGERIADAAIAVYHNFGDWSDHMLDQFDSDAGYRGAANAFRQELEDFVSGPENRSREGVGPRFRKGLDGILSRRSGHDYLWHEVVRSYRNVLASYALDCKPLISPSVFLLDRHGDVAMPAPPDVLANQRLCGLDESSQFAPLPKHVRETNSRLLRKMQKHYRRYRKELIDPLFESLADSQSMIVLVDIPSLLLGGVDRYNDNRQIVLDLFETMQGDSSIGRLLRQLKFWSPALQRIAFVATKADLVKRSDWNNGRLKSLLRSMNSRAKSLLPDVQIGWFQCSACISTATVQADDDKLIGVLDNSPERLQMEFNVSSLPEEWPDDWDRDSYLFPSVFPEPPRNYQRDWSSCFTDR